ncbi:MAG: tyrosine--tRNA ligase [Parcubacteria group bacterium]|nr:tyrosine--tRNA ligase [Parcubacteria group bacterium]
MFGKIKSLHLDTNSEKIEEFLTRGVENVYPNKDFVTQKLKSGDQLTFYYGIDPTAPSLHIGHSAPLLKLKSLQDLGHKIIVLIGDFTAMIGDPDKVSVRKQLTRAEVLTNCRKYKEQIGRIISFSGNNKAEFVFNSKWLSKMNFGDVLDLASKMTVDQMLKRDMFAKRVEENKPIYIHEFMYPLMQGYDSVVLGVDGEIGGNDQTFNMLAGRTLMKQFSNKEKIVIATKLLTDSFGNKMGKTEGNAVILDQNESDMFGAVMSWGDISIIPAFTLVTCVSLDKIENIKKRLEAGENPRDIKIELARTIVSIYHGEKAGEKAEKDFTNVFKKGGVPESIQEIKMKTGGLLIDVLLENNIVSSKTDFRRLVSDGAVSIVETDEKITTPNFKIEKTTTFRVGKKRFVKLVV